MKKALRLLSLLALLGVSWATRAQESLTVADGSATNSYVPVYGLYVDDFLRCQTVYPADDLAEMTGGTITELTYYLTSPAPDSWGAASFVVNITEVDATSLSGFADMLDATTVYSGALDGTQSTMTIQFDAPYTYQGGNLLIEIYSTATGSYKTVTFAGIEASNASWQGYNSSSWLNVSGNARSFIPKTTFGYTPGDVAICARPATIEATDVTAHEATISWSSEGAYSVLEYKRTADDDWTAIDIFGDATLYITGLQQNTAYEARVKAVCDDGGESSYRTVAFTTLISCPAPTAPTVTLTPGNGTVATFGWTAGANEQAWQICLDNDESNLISTSTPYYNLTGLTPEQTYSVKVRAYCDADDQSSWSTAVNFTPTNAYQITLNDGTATNNYVPVYGYYVDGSIVSQFIIPEEDLAAMVNGTVNMLTFYCNNGTLDFGSAMFEVYMTDVDYTTFASATLVDWGSMTKVMDAAPLTINSGIMEVELDNPYLYNGGNLMIGIKQTVSGSYHNTSWFGVSATGASLGGNNTGSQRNFLPKTTIDYTPGGAVVCNRPGAIVVGEVEATTATISWTAGGDESSWNVYLNDELTATVASPAYTFSNLTPSSNYTIGVTAVCSEESSMRTLQIRTTGIPATLPYQSGFEEGEDQGWEFANSINGWFIGPATNNGGSQAMYVSNDNGATNSYNVSSAASSYAYRTFHLEAQDHAFSFDWIANGESNYDYLRVFVVPADVTFTADNQSGIGTSGTPDGWIALDGAVKLNLNTGWTTVSGTFGVEEAGMYNLVFYWRNDNSGGTNPPAAVDNVMLAPLSCSAPTALEATDITASSVTLTWNDEANQGATYIIYNVNDGAADAVGTTTEHTFTVDGLAPLTPYTFRVVASCGGDDDISFPVNIAVATIGEGDMCQYVISCTSTSSYSNPFSSYGAAVEVYQNGALVATANSEVDTVNVYSDYPVVFRYKAASSTYYNSYAAVAITNGLGLEIFNQNGLSGRDTLATVSVACPNCFPVQWVEALDLTTTGAQLVWLDDRNDSSFVTYTIYNVTDGSVYATGVVGNSTWVDGLVENYEYVFSVQANCNGDEASEPVSTYVKTLASCLPVSDLAATDVTANSVTLTWNDYDNQGAMYVVYIVSDGSAANNEVTTAQNTFTFNGLTPNTNYTFGVRTLCDDVYADLATVSVRTLFAIDCGNGSSVTVSNADSSSTTNSNLPASTYYNYSYSEVIIPASRLEGIGTVKALQFKPTNTTGGDQLANCTIYMANTTVENLSAAFIQDVESFQLVWSGDMGYTEADWQSLSLDTPFEWDGVSNIVVAVLRSTGTYSSNASFASYNAGTSMGRYIRNDSSPYTLGNIGAGTAVSTVPLYRLVGCEGVFEPTIDTIFVEACDSYTRNGSVFTESGTYSQQDNWLRTTVIELTLLSSSAAEVDITANDSYAWGDSIYNVSGTYTRTFVNSVGCDSVVTLHLTINYASNQVDSAVACDSYEWHGMTFTQSGTYFDSSDVLVLTINSSFATSETVAASEYYVWNGSYYNASGIYTSTFVNSAGCDSVVTLYLTVVPAAATVPYSTGFEAGEDASWVFANSSNGWFIGQATSNGGSQAMYISNDDGVSNTYSTSANAASYAYRPVDLEAQEYSFSFDWTTVGESSWDYLRVFLVPASVTFEAGNQSGIGTSGAPAGWIALDGGSQLTGSSNWNSVSNVFTLEEAGLYNIVFYWRNDYSAGSQPPAAVDNVTLTVNEPVVCPDVIYDSVQVTTCGDYAWNGTVYTESGDYSYTWLDENGCTVESYLLLTISGTSCDITIVGHDSYGDGWNGNAIAIFQNGAQVGTFTLTDGSEYTESYNVCAGSPVSLNWVSGGYANETSFEVSTLEGQIYEGVGGGMSNVTFLTIDNACSGCIPATLYAIDRQATSVTLGWSGAADSGATYALYYGDDMMLLDSALTGDSYTVEGLQPNTICTFWLVTTCTDGSQSSPKQFQCMTQCGETTYDTVSETTCGSYWWYGTEYTATGEYTYTETDNNGCIAMHNMVLTVMPNYYDTVEANATGYYVWYGDTLTGDGLYAHYDYSVSGCDSIEYLSLTVAVEVACEGGYSSVTVSNADASDANINYIPGYSFYNYSYSEVIIPAERLEGIGTVKALQFKPTTATGGDHFNNCEVYLANTDVADLSAGFVENRDAFELVWSGDMSYTSDSWQTLVFDSPFVYDGSSNVVVAVIRNYGSYANGSNFAAYTADAQLGRYMYQDSSPYEIGTIGSGTQAATNTPAWYRLIGCNDGAVIACSRVRDLNANQVTAHSVELGWSDDANSDAAYYIYTVAPYDTALIGTTDDMSYTVTGLDANTVYTFAVQAVCNDSEASSMARLTVRTSCDAIAALPYVNDFENEPNSSSAIVDAIPLCWQRYNDAEGSYYPYVNSNSYNANSGSQYLYFYSSNYGSGPNTQMAVLPPVDIDVYSMDALRLRFYARRGYGDNATLTVGVMTDPADLTTFTTVQDVTVENNNQYEMFTVSGFPADGGQYIALRIDKGDSYTYVYVDDVTLDLIPDCPDVTALHVQDASQNSITLAWSSTADSYQLTTADGIVYYCYDTVFTVYDLMPNTSYTFAVNAVCVSGVGVPSTISATTTSVPAMLPYFTSFDGEDQGWQFTNNDVNAWVIGTAAATDGSMGLYISNNNGDSNSYNISDQATSYAYRLFQFDQAGTYVVSFDWRAYGESSYDYMRVWLAPATMQLTANNYPDNGSNYNGSYAPQGWLNIGERLNSNADWQYMNQEVYVDNPGNYYLVFMWRNDNSMGTQPAAAVDKVSIALYEQPVCQMPDSIQAETTVNTATITWSSTGSETAWQVEVYGDNNYYRSFYSYEPTVTLDDLAANSNYEIAVMSLCDFGSSDWNFAQFTTADYGQNLDCEEGICSITIVGHDSYGDSWNGNAITVSQNGETVGYFTVADGYDNSAEIAVCVAQPISFSWITGYYLDETSFQVYNADGQTVLNVTNGSWLQNGSFLTMQDCHDTPAVVIESVDSVQTCDSYWWNGTYYTESGMYEYEYTDTAAGSPTFHSTLYLTVNYSTSTVIDTVVYGKFVYYGEDGSYWWDMNYSDVIQLEYNQTVFGCDSSTYLNVTVLPMAVDDTLYRTECGGGYCLEMISDEGEQYSECYYESGIHDNVLYYDSVNNLCVGTVAVTLGNSYYRDTTIVARDSYVWQGETYTQNTSFEERYTTALGCDSVMYTYLRIVTGDTLHVNACDYYENGYGWYDVSGIYIYDTTVHYEEMRDSVEVYTYQYGDSVYTYYDTMQYFMSYDVTTSRILDLTINHSVSTDTLILFDGTPVEWNGITYTEPGYYQYTTVMANGCDSTANLRLVQMSTDVITMNGPGYLYGYQNGSRIMGDTTFYFADMGDSRTYQFATFNTTTGEQFGVPAEYCRVVSVVLDGENLDLNDIPSYDGMLEYGYIVYELTVEGNQNHTLDIVYGPFDDQTSCSSLSDISIRPYDVTTEVSWTAGTGTDTYHVYYGLYDQFNADSLSFDGDFGYQEVVANGDRVSCTLTDMQPNTHYAVLIVMYCDNGGWWYAWRGFYTSGDPHTISISNNGGFVHDLSLLGLDTTVSYQYYEGWTYATYLWSVGTVSAEEYNISNDRRILYQVIVDGQAVALGDSNDSYQFLPYMMDGEDVGYYFRVAFNADHNVQFVFGPDTNEANLRDTVAVDVIACDSYEWNNTVISQSGTYVDAFSNTDTVFVLNLTIVSGTVDTIAETACDSYRWNNITYTESGLYERTYQGSNGCMNTEMLDLTINRSTADTTTVVACDSYEWNGNLYVLSDIYTRRSVNEAGCIHLSVLDLTVNSNTAGDTAATACESFAWYDNTYGESGNYTHVIANNAGCDSTVTLHLTIMAPAHTAFTVQACENYAWNDASYNTSGDYIYAHADANGCTQVDTLHLTVLHSSASESTVQACNSYTWNGTAYTTSGTYTYTTTNSVGCDSVATLVLTIDHCSTIEVTACENYDWDGDVIYQEGTYVHGTDTLVLTINHNSMGFEEITACNSYVWHGTEYTESTNDAVYHTLNAVGCDSMIMMHLTIEQCSSTQITACESYEWRGYTLTNSGTYVDGFDTLYLTINGSTSGDVIASACGEYTWLGNTYTESGDYTAVHPVHNVYGCDSLVTLHLTINQCNAYYETACDSYTWNGNTYTSSGRYVYGNDTLYLTINRSNRGDTFAVACNSFVWYDNAYSENGTYTHLLEGANAKGCDSTVTLHLVVRDCNSITVEACESYQWNGINYINSGDYRSGNDSLHLTIKRAVRSDVFVSACNSYDWYDYTGLTESQTVTYTLAEGAANGCDSIVTLHLTINQCSTVEATACDSYVWNGITFTSSGVYNVGFDTLVLTIKNATTGDTVAQSCGSFEWHDNVYTESGNYTVTLADVNDCDSIVTLHLNIANCSDTTVTACDSYLWHGNTYTSSGVYVDGFETLRLTVNRSTTGDTFAIVCGGYEWNGNAYSESGNYTYTTTNAAGCDSVATLHLVVRQCNTIAAEACNSYTWNGQTFTSSGTYIVGQDTLVLTINRTSRGDTLAVSDTAFSWYEYTDLAYSQSVTHTFVEGNVHGCDSVVTLHLQINSKSIASGKDNGTTYRTVCDSTVWHGFTIASSGTYSIGNDTLVLTVKHSSTGDTVAEACNSFEWFDNAYAESGNYTYVTTNSVDCDSVVTLHLTVNRCSLLDTTVCDSYLWRGYTVTSSGTYIEGRDTLHLTVKRSSRGDTTAMACSSFDWYEYSGSGYSQNLSHTFVGAAANGCDSIVTLHLTINQCSTTDTAVCSSFNWKGYTLTSSGTYTVGHDTLNLTILRATTGFESVSASNRYVWKGRLFTASTDTATYLTTNAAGCDSTVTLHLTINPSTRIDTTVCGSYLWKGYNITSSGTYIEGFDTLNLVVNSSTSGLQFVAACSSYNWHGTDYTESTNAFNAPTFDTLNAAGCDSTVTLYLTINSCSNTTVTACESYSWHGYNITSSGTYADGLDTLHLTINRATSGDTIANVVGSFLWRGSSYTESGNYLFTLENAAGCDSLVTLHLTVNPSSTTNISSCDSYTWRGSNYTNSGQYIVGYDTLNLVINRSTTALDTASDCSSYTWHGRTFTASTDTATYHTTNAAGCDSTVTLFLTIKTPVHAAFTEQACESYSWNGTDYSQSGNYTYQHADANGCTQVDTLHLTINTPVHQSVSEAACESYTWNGTDYSQSGNYIYQHADANGCTQVDTLHLTINHSVETYDTLTVGSNELPVAYGGRSLNAAGDYDFEFTTTAGCDSTVHLHFVVNNGIADVELEQISLYPNPTSGSVTISYTDIATVEVLDITGRVAAVFHNTNTFDISHLPAGSYTLRITVLYEGNALQAPVVRKVVKR